jgi:hypothetical protein
MQYRTIDRTRSHGSGDSNNSRSAAAEGIDEADKGEARESEKGIDRRNPLNE